MTSRRPEALDPRVISLDLAGSPHDLFKDGQIQKIAARGRLTAFISAAVTKIADCEQDPVGSRLVNVTNTVELGKRLLATGAGVIFMSSNAVFSGLEPFPTESHKPDPYTDYGRQKAEAEQGLLGVHASMTNAPPLMIVRLTKVVARINPLIASWIENLRAGIGISAFEDRRLSPISLGYTVESLVRIAKKGNPGIYHVSGSRDLSYYEFACLLASSLGADPELVTPVLADVAVSGLTHRHSALGGTPGNEILALGAEDPQAVSRSLVS
jgi:dTDP-4-dehydrorhamnose reductase